jgi:hypothetical protein
MGLAARCYHGHQVGVCSCHDGYQAADLKTNNFGQHQLLYINNLARLHHTASASAT